MAVSIFDNGKGFPRLTNNTSSLIKPEESKVYQDNSRPLNKSNLSSKIEKLTDTQKYCIGSSMLAISVIAGLLINKKLKKTTPMCDDYKSKDAFVRYLSHLHPKFEAKNIIETTNPKGWKRVDKLLYPAGIRCSEFLRKDGTKFANVKWNQQGRVLEYQVFKKNGTVARQYSI